MFKLLLGFFIKYFWARTVLLEIGTILGILPTIYLKLVMFCQCIAIHLQNIFAILFIQKFCYQDQIYYYW